MPTSRRFSLLLMNSEEKNQHAGTNDLAGNNAPTVNSRMTPGSQNPLDNSATQAETSAMKPEGGPLAAEPNSLQMAASGQPLGATAKSEDHPTDNDAGAGPVNKDADPNELASREPNRRGRKPGTPNKPKDGAPQASAKAADATAGASRRARQPNGKPEASSDSRQPDTYGGNFGNDVQTSFQDQERYQNQLGGAGRGEFGVSAQRGGTHGGYGNQYRESDYDNRSSAEDRYYGGPGRYGHQHNAYRDYDGRDERGYQPNQGNYGYNNQNSGRGNYDDHGYDRHGFNNQGGHYYGPNEGYDPRHAGGYGYNNDSRYDQPRPGDRGQGGNRSGDGYYQQGRPGEPRGYNDGRGNQHDNRNQPDRDDRRSGYQNDNGSGPGRPGMGYANDYGQSSFGGPAADNNRGRDPRHDNGNGYDRRNQNEDYRSSRGGYDNQGSGGGRAGHQDDNGRYGQQGYQSGYGAGYNGPVRNQGGPARDQSADPRQQPTEGYGYGHGRDERGGRPDYRTGDQRNGYGNRGSYNGDSNQGYGSRGGSYNDEYDNGNRGQGQQGPGSPNQGDYTRQDRARNYGPGAQQRFRSDNSEGEKDNYGPMPRRNPGRDGEHDE
jgi:hypothetical protein